MRFSYNPESGYLSVFSNSDELHLTSDVFQDVNKTGEREYKVLTKKLKNEDGSNNEEFIISFLQDYVKFVTKIFGDLNPTSKIKDVILLCTMPKEGFLWSSLLDLENGGSSTNFLDMLLNYGCQTIVDSTVDKKNDEKPEDLIDILSEDDFAKLALARVILASINHSSIWKKKNQTDIARDQLKNELASILKKTNKYEKKYGFSTEDLKKYYADDKYPEKDMKIWLELADEEKAISKAIKKYDLVNEMVKQWRDSF